MISKTPMMNRALAHIIATLTGTTIIYLILQAETYIWTFLQYGNEHRDHLDWMFSDLHIFGTFFITMLLVQFSVIRPILNRWSNKQRLSRKKLFAFGFVISIVSGILFGLFFGSTELGVSDILSTFGIGAILFSIYYLTTFWTYLKLSK